MPQKCQKKQQPQLPLRSGYLLRFGMRLAYMQRDSKPRTYSVHTKCCTSYSCVLVRSYRT